MKMTQETDVLKAESTDLGMLLEDMKSRVFQAARDGEAVHVVEKWIWEQLLRMGKQALKQFFALQGTGDVGESVTLPDGRSCPRLENLHPRRYVSIFGEFVLRRTVYGSREGQRIEFVPLDNRLQLPGSDFSYVLQDWDQSFCVEQAFGPSAEIIRRMLGLRQSVDSLEQMNADMSQHVADFREAQPQPEADEEGTLLVTSADGKGIVMRRPKTAAAPGRPGRRRKGEKANQKRMATVGAAYTVDRHVRTPEEVVAALFRDGPERPERRPKPKHKRVWASLSLEDGEKFFSSVDVVYTWLKDEVDKRNPKRTKEMVHICDAQEALWQARDRYLPQENATNIADLLHVSERVWQAAHVFYSEGSADAEQFARERLLRILQGHADLVVRGLRQMATKRHLVGSKRKTLTQVCNYLENNRERMHYDVYLARGYPIASGVIEGACRHLVKDRMERAGMHWTFGGAQCMLNVRSVYVNGDWEAYQAFRIEREMRRLYPCRELVSGPEYQMAC
jgi:hypothetical protein